MPTKKRNHSIAPQKPKSTRKDTSSKKLPEGPKEALGGKVASLEAATLNPDGVTAAVDTVNVKRQTYKQNWRPYNWSQTHEKSDFRPMLYELCATIPDCFQETALRGRRCLPPGDQIYAATYKVYCAASGRRSDTDLREAHATGFLTKHPSYNSIFRYLQSEEMTPYLHQLISMSALPLKAIESKFAVDSTGFSTSQFLRWSESKNCTKEERRQWRKAHIMCGVKTNIITAVEITDGYSNDYHHLKPLVNHTAKSGFIMKEISADKAYLGGENLLTALRHGAIPFIPFKKNSVSQGGTYGPKSKIWTRMFNFYTYHQEEFKAHYHLRSNAETTFHMIKSKFRARLRSKTYTAQTNELLCKILCHNICVVNQSVHELGIETEFDQWAA